MRSLRRLTALISLSIIAAAVTASPALAENIPTWQNPGITSMTGSLTLREDGVSPISCSFAQTFSATSNEPVASFAISVNHLGFQPVNNCSNVKSWTWEVEGVALYNATTKAFSLEQTGASEFLQAEPWNFGGWRGEPVAGNSIAWTNGSGSTASKATFSEVFLGYTVGGHKVTASGTISVLNNSTKTAEILTTK